MVVYGALVLWKIVFFQGIRSVFAVCLGENFELSGVKHFKRKR